MGSVCVLLCHSPLFWFIVLLVLVLNCCKHMMPALFPCIRCNNSNDLSDWFSRLFFLLLLGSYPKSYLISYLLITIVTTGHNGCVFLIRNELYMGDENYCIFTTKNPKLTVHVWWQGNSKILQLKFICVHNLCNNDHHVELLTFNQDRVKISLAFVFIVAFVTCNFYGKEKIVKHTQIGYNFIYLINVRNIYHTFFKIASTHQKNTSIIKAFSHQLEKTNFWQEFDGLMEWFNINSRIL